MLPIVVFDTNILIAATLSQSGSPNRCLKLAEEGKIKSVTCREIIDEFQEKLALKFGYSPQRIRGELQKLLNYSQLVTITNTLKVITADPDDNKIVECAVVGDATHIITGDKKHLLPIVTYQGIAIVSAADFLASVSD